MELHEKISYTRQYCNKSRQELATHLGLSVKTIAAIETGTRTVQPSVLKAVSEFLNIPLEFYVDPDVKTIEEYTATWQSKKMLKDKEKYAGYFKLVDTAKDADADPEEFKEVLAVIRKIRSKDKD